MSDHTTIAPDSKQNLRPRRQFVQPGPAYYGLPSLIIFNDAGWHWCHHEPPVYFGHPRRIVWERLH